MAQETSELTITSQYGPLGEFTLLDDKLLQAAEQNWTPNRIAKKYGMRPEEAVMRIKALLDSTDVWTSLERKKLLISSAMRIKEKLDEYLEEMPFNTKQLGQYISLLRFISERLDKEAQFTEEELTRVTDAQQRAIIAAVETGFYSVREYLRDYHPDVDLQEIDKEFREGLMKGFVSNE